MASKLARRRHLLDRPQRFGIWPTWWFWNDHAQQHYLIPIGVLTMPLYVALFMLSLPWWALLGLNLLECFLLQGLVERHIRRRLSGEVVDSRTFERLVVGAGGVGSIAIIVQCSLRWGLRGGVAAASVLMVPFFILMAQTSVARRPAHLVAAVLALVVAYFSGGWMVVLIAALQAGLVAAVVPASKRPHARLRDAHGQGRKALSATAGSSPPT